MLAPKYPANKNDGVKLLRFIVWTNRTLNPMGKRIKNKLGNGIDLLQKRQIRRAIQKVFPVWTIAVSLVHVPRDHAHWWGDRRWGSAITACPDRLDWHMRMFFARGDVNSQ